MKAITQKTLNFYAQLTASIKRATELREKKRDEIIKALQAGAVPSSNGPWLLQLIPNGGKEIDWKFEFELYLCAEFSRTMSVKAAVIEAKKVIAAKYKSAPDKEGIIIQGKNYVGGVKVKVEPVNPDYQTKTEKKTRAA